MIAIDRRLLVREIVAAVREDTALRAEVLAALGLDGTSGMVSPATYAARRAISTRTVRRAIEDGRLPYERIGRLVRVPADAVIAPRSRSTADGARSRIERTLGIGARR